MCTKYDMASLRFLIQPSRGENEPGEDDKINAIDDEELSWEYKGANFEGNSIFLVMVSFQVKASPNGRPST